MKNKDLENAIETSWESKDEINEKTVGMARKLLNKL